MQKSHGRDIRFTQHIATFVWGQPTWLLVVNTERKRVKQLIRENKIKMVSVLWNMVCRSWKELHEMNQHKHRPLWTQHFLKGVKNNMEKTLMPIRVPMGGWGLFCSLNEMLYQNTSTISYVYKCTIIFPDTN